MFSRTAFSNSLESKGARSKAKKFNAEFPVKTINKGVNVKSFVRGLLSALAVCKGFGSTVARYRYVNSWCWFFVSAAMYSYLLAINWVNPVPRQEDLVRFSANRIELFRRSPELKVGSAEHPTTWFHLPDVVTFERGRFNRLLPADLAGSDCDGYVAGAPLRWVLSDTVVAWEVKCGRFEFSYSEAVRHYAETQRIFHKVLGVLMCVSLLLGAFVLWIERKRGRERPRVGNDLRLSTEKFQNKVWE